MSVSQSLLDQITAAYDHLYDLVYLRTCALRDALIPDTTMPPKERAWRLQRLLLQAIEDLNPGKGAPLTSSEYRRYQLMVWHYIDGLGANAVAHRLAISRRHFYREHDAALEAIAALVAHQGAANAKSPAERADSVGSPPLTHLELVRREAGRVARPGQPVSLVEIIQGAVEVVREAALARGVALEIVSRAPECSTSADVNLLRQVLIVLLNHFVEHCVSEHVLVETGGEEGHVAVRVRASGGPHWAQGATQAEDSCLAVVNELAAMQNMRVRTTRTESSLEVELDLPRKAGRTVLVVDDNEDEQELLRRYLEPPGYQVITARSGTEALTLAKSQAPFAITLDLMMAGQDGWEVLQKLANQHDTQHIPVIVCTVLSARELALSLGAYAFLPKPVQQSDLVHLLDTIGSD